MTAYYYKCREADFIKTKQDRKRHILATSDKE